MVVEHAGHRGGVEPALAGERLGGEGFAGEALQRPAQPCRDRDREALLGPLQHLARQQRRQGLAQQPLLRPAPHLQRRCQAERARRDLVVEEGHAQLQRVGHARAVGLDQQVVDQIDAEVDVLEAGQRLRPGGLGVALAVEVDRVPARVAAAEQRRLSLAREDLLPGVVALQRRQAGAAGEALGFVVEADLGVGAGQQLGQRRRERGEPADAGGEQVGDVGVVAAEQLVAALAGEGDLDLARRQLGDQVGRQRRGVAEGLVEGLDQLREELDRVGAQDDLVMLGAVALGDQPRPLELVEARLLEADREGLHRIGLLAGGERDQTGRVDPAGEQHADRHVGNQVGADGVAQGLAQLARELVGGAALRPLGLDRRRPRVAAQAQLAVAPDGERAGRQLARLGEDRQRRRDRVEGEEGGDGARLDLAREARLLEQRLELGGEGERALAQAVVERLDPEAVAGEQQALLALVPDRHREHAAQPLGEALAVLLVEVDEHLGVGGGAEAVAAALELTAQLAVVVDLAVLDDDDAAVLVGDRLIAAGEVDDRESPHRQRHAVSGKAALAVRPPVHEPRVHPPHRLGVRAGPDHATDPTHGRAVSHPQPRSRLCPLCGDNLDRGDRSQIRGRGFRRYAEITSTALSWGRRGRDRGP